MRATEWIDLEQYQEKEEVITFKLVNLPCFREWGKLRTSLPGWSQLLQNSQKAQGIHLEWGDYLTLEVATAFTCE